MAALAAACMAPCPDAAQAQAAPLAQAVQLAPGVQELLLDVTVNGATVPGPTAALREPDGTLLLPAEDFARWRLRVPPALAVTRAGQRYYRVDAIPGLRATLDPARLRLAIDASGEALDETVLTATGWSAPPPTVSPLGGFFNYNLLGERFQGDNRFAGLFEAGLFGPHGVAIGSFTATNEPQTVDGWTASNVVRLDTFLRRDDPARMLTLIAGDTVNAPGIWGRPVRFGGLQYGRNFGIQPGFITFPLQAAAGIATVPSTVDIIVNNTRVGQQQVPPGPFSITDIPPITGAGEVQLVVRDALGREQVVTQPFYASRQLLRAGLDEFSVEVGSVRTDYGLRSNGYQGVLGSGFYRRGLTDRFTAGVRAETYRDITSGGIDADWLVGRLGVLSGALVGSSSDAGEGVLALAGFEHRSSGFSVTGRGTWASDDFRQVGFVAGQQPLARQLLASASYSFGVPGTLGLVYGAQSPRGAATREAVSATWSVNLRGVGYLSLSATRSMGDTRSTDLLALLTIPLGPSTSATLSVDRTKPSGGDAQTEASVTLQRSLPPGPGYGYRFFGRTDRQAQAGLALQNEIGTVFLDAARRDGEDAYRVNVLGGIGLLGGRPFLARSLNESFGLVRVGDFPGVRVLQDNQVVARTDADGYAVLPRLRAYDRNPVSITLSDLPLGARIDGTRIVAVPYYRSGILFDFPVARERAAVLTILLGEGSPLPAGATVRVLETGEEFPVALRGEVYVTGLGDTNRLRATWKDQTCDIDVRYPATDDPVADLGEALCAGVRP